MQTSHHLSVVFRSNETERLRNKFIKSWLAGAVYILQSDNGLAFPSKAHYGTFRPSEPSQIEIYN